jgi:pSer/pThr/pTyr-binding forkhead associated (FHA) protein
LGRSKKSTIILKHDDYVSNRHCAFEVQRDKSTNRPLLFVEDLGSRNGTYVDDVEVYDGKAQLFHGSRIRVGDTVLVVVEIPF